VWQRSVVRFARAGFLARRAVCSNEAARCSISANFHSAQSAAISASLLSICKFIPPAVRVMSRLLGERYIAKVLIDLEGAHAYCASVFGGDEHPSDL